MEQGLSGSGDRNTTVSRQGAVRDEGRGIRCQEEHGPRDLVGGRQALERMKAERRR